jgi:hypothetical protein
MAIFYLKTLIINSRANWTIINNITTYMSIISIF